MRTTETEGSCRPFLQPFGVESLLSCGVVAVIKSYFPGRLLGAVRFSSESDIFMRLYFFGASGLRLTNLHNDKKN